MSDIRVFAALRADDPERLARVIEEVESARLMSIAPINPPAGLVCAVCEQAVNDLASIVAYGGLTVTHAGMCQLRMDLRLAEAREGFDFHKWLDE